MTTFVQDSLPSAPTDDATASLLDALGAEWRADDDYLRFVTALAQAAREGRGVVRQNDVRRRLTNEWGRTIAPHRFGPFYRRACKDGLLRPTGRFDVNDDLLGRNRGKPQHLYAWCGGGL